jgi:hypothetical protein
VGVGVDAKRSRPMGDALLNAMENYNIQAGGKS